MPDASNSLQKRKRGGQPGNSNRRVHGRYAKEEAARRDALRAMRRKGRALVILVDNVLKARKALKRRLAARALAAASSTLARENAVHATATEEQRGAKHNWRVRTLPAKRLAAAGCFARFLAAQS